MKTPAITNKLIALAGTFAVLAPTVNGQISIPYADGSDLALNITSGTNIIELSQAVTGVWTNTSTSPGNGIYDPTQWAVIFKYSSVSISAGATVAFANHPTHAPVVWLVNGNVTINGNLNLDGQGATTDTTIPEPGPGGFRGGGGSSLGFGPGFGPGGAPADGYYAGTYAGAYGNPQIVPLIGGSGGIGGYGGNSGCAGGGAILIAATGTITVNGYCHADGGASRGYAGSGGAAPGRRSDCRQRHD